MKFEEGYEQWENDNDLLDEITETLHDTFGQVANDEGTRYLLLDEEAKTQDQKDAKNALIAVTQDFDKKRREMHVRSRRYDLEYHKWSVERLEATDEMFGDIKDLLVEIRDALKPKKPYEKPVLRELSDLGKDWDETTPVEIE